MLGLVYTIDFPESLKALIVCGATASKGYMNSPHSIYSADHPHNAFVREQMRIVKAPESTPEQRQAAVRAWNELSLYRPEKYDEYFATPSSGKTVAKRLDYYSSRDLPHFDVRSLLTKVTTPTLIICGRHDAQCPPEFSEEIHQLIPTSTLAILEESNHFPFIEEPDEFNQIVRTFSEQVGLH
jgi:proline iminopeptidase